MKTTECGKKQSKNSFFAKTNHAGVYIPYKPSEHWAQRCSFHDTQLARAIIARRDALRQQQALVEQELALVEQEILDLQAQGSTE